jgi:hypothetical protein
MPDRLNNFYKITSYLFLGIVVFAMVFYSHVILSTKGTMDDLGNVIVAPTSTDSLLGNIYTGVYSLVVVVFGTLYKKIAEKQTNDENHRYQKSFDDALIKRLFLFNALNFYVPLILVAFDTRNARNYDDLFSLLLTQMAYKQIAMNLIEYLTPILRVKKKLDAIQVHFRKTLEDYLPTE